MILLHKRKFLNMREFHLENEIPLQKKIPLQNKIPLQKGIPFTWDLTIRKLIFHQETLISIISFVEFWYSLFCFNVK